MAYHGCLCPGCFWKGIYTTLYIIGSEEANKYWNEKLKKEVVMNDFIGGNRYEIRMERKSKI